MTKILSAEGPHRLQGKRAVALSSGGKDSILALHLAVQAGLRVESVLTVFPEDPDSMLYHTYNLAHVKLIAHEMGLDWRTMVAKREEEESALVVALDRLNTEVVVTGGVASNYQRIRFERAAASLGLAVYAPLWGMTAQEEYAKIHALGMDVLVVAVAAYGLGQDWLGTHLTRERTSQLLRLARRFGFNAVGEGGDLDTFVLDAPLYGRRLEVAEASTTWRGDAGVYEIKALRAVGKAGRL